MKFKKLGLVMTTVFAGAALVTLSGCSSSDSASKDIITMKGDTIRVSDLYKEAKQFPSQPTNTLLQNLTFDKIFTKDFGKEVTDKDVSKKVKSIKDQYGSQFSSALQQQGLTEASFTPYMRTQMLEQAAIDHEIKETQYTDANLKKAWGVSFNNFKFMRIINKITTARTNHDSKSCLTFGNIFGSFFNDTIRRSGSSNGEIVTKFNSLNAGLKRLRNFGKIFKAKFSDNHNFFLSSTKNIIT